MSDTWPLSRADVIYNANMIHIAPFDAAVGLFRGAGRLLPAHGMLFTYGPYKFGGKHTAESNASFDQSLRSRNLSWGVRDVDELEKLAARCGMQLSERVPMPANNFSLVWKKLA